MTVFCHIIRISLVGVAMNLYTFYDYLHTKLQCQSKYKSRLNQAIQTRLFHLFVLGMRGCQASYVTKNEYKLVKHMPSSAIFFISKSF